MKNLFTLALACGLMLAGCAGKKAVEEPPVAEVPPPVIEQPAPAVVEKAPAPEPVKPEPVKVAVEQAAERIFFEFDSSTISEESRAALEGNARWLQDQKEIRLVIEGHADARGSDTYNLALGEKRARAAREYLTALGVADERIEVISYGEEKAAQEAKSEAAWAQDRKAEFVIAN